MLNKIIAEVEALKVEDDSTGLKQNHLLEKVLEILRKYKVNEDNLLKGVGK